MNADVIKDFLISLGFQVDDSGAKKFDATLTSITLNAVKAGAAIEATALSVVAFTAKIASGLDNLYWASQRTGATVAGIQAIGYAASQAGGSAEAARGSLESLSRFMRNSPGAEGFLNRLGVQTRDASGNMRDMASIFTGVGQKLNSMPYYRANQYAQMLGIDENTLMAMRRGLGQFSTQYTQMAKAIGYNADTAAVSSNKFMTSLRSFGQMAGMARDKIGSNIAEGLSGSLDTLRKQVLDNFPKIEGAITSGINGLLRLADIIGRVIFRLIQAGADLKNWWDSLDKSTQGLIELIGGLTVAWWALNRAMLASPITWVLGLAAGIALLWEDYKTWKEGGKSLIDWSKWEPGIKYATAAIKGLGKDFGGLFDKVKSLGSVIADAVKHLGELINIDTSKFSGKWLFDQITESVRSSIKMIGAMVDALRKIISGDFTGAWSSLKDFAKTGIESPLGQGVKAAGGGLYGAANGIVNGAYFQANDIVNGGYQYANHALNSLLPAWAGGSSGNLPDRNNNPGNLRPVSGNGFRTFGSALEGWGAMRNQLMRYFNGKTTGKSLKTISDIVSTWAPSSENDTGKYISDISKWMGVSPDAALNLNNPQVMTSLMQSMARKEGFSAWNSPLAGQAAGNTVHQQNTYNIYGGNAREIGDQVGRSVNEKAVNIGNNKVGAG